MNAGKSVFAAMGSVLVTGVCACTGPIQGGLTSYTEAAPIASPAGAASAAGAAAPLSAATAHPEPRAVAAAPPPAAAVPPAATPAAAASAPTTPASAPGASASGAQAPVTSNTTTTATTTTTTMQPTASTFDAGSGTALPDGQTVEYRIPDGTGGTDWNPRDNPIRVKRGMVLRLIDEDMSTRSGGHWLHTNGQPCPHGLRAIGDGFDCSISMNAPIGRISGVFEHNVANGIGQLHIEIVADTPN